jgi:hypothetical protein
MAIKLSKSSIIRTGLISYLDASIMKSYPKSGSLWYDLSNRGNNGSLISSPTFDSTNKGNLVFNGTNYVDCGDSPMNLTTGGTVSVWAKITDWSGSGNYWGISGKGASAGFDTNGYTIWLYSPNDLYCHIANRTPVEHSSVGLIFGTSSSLGTTIHNYTMTWNMSGLTAYLDGNYVNYAGYTYGAGDSTGQPYLIAKDQCSTKMKGSVYLNLVYNRCLSASEVLHNYEVVKPRFIPSINTPLPKIKITSGIIRSGLKLLFDASNNRCYSRTGNTWFDLSMNGYGSTMSAVTYDTITKSFDFPAVDTNYIASTCTRQDTDYTLMVWFKDDGTIRTYERLVDKNYVSGFWLGRNNNIANTWGGGILESTDPYGVFLTFAGTGWHCITSLRSGTTHTLYGDGITNTTGNTVSATALDSTSLTIGNWYNYNNSQSFGGKIGMVMYYNRALTPSEVLQNYNTTKLRFT